MRAISVTLLGCSVLFLLCDAILTTGTDKYLTNNAGGLTRSIFTVVRFLNVPCSSPNGQLTGICFSLSDCIKLQGMQIGTCASGYGVCCIFRRTCGVATNQNLTHFTNPGFPDRTSDPGESVCTLTLLRPTRTPLCQIRLDFLEFDLTRPTDGICIRDVFRVSGLNPNSPMPELCGLNTGQHVYLNVEDSVNPIVLAVNTRGEWRRNWNIRAQFIECTSPSKAPNNCLQYYTGRSGTFSSFNYVPNEAPVSSGGYLNRLNYAICFRKEAGYCTQTYSVPPGQYFQILNLNSDNSPTVGNAEAGLGVAECPADYLRLGGDRYCGARLNPSTGPVNPTTNAPVTDSTAGPFIAQFVTNDRITAIGFLLQYLQNPCNSG